MNYQVKREIIRNNQLIKYLWYSVIIINLYNLIVSVIDYIDLGGSQLFTFGFAAPLVAMIALWLLILQILQILIIFGIFRLWSIIRYLLIIFIIVSYTLGGGFVTLPHIINQSIDSNQSGFLPYVISMYFYLIMHIISIYTVVAYWLVIRKLHKYDLSTEKSSKN